MEDYKEKYEMALEKAKILLSKCKRISDKASMIYRAEDIESMFPEFQKPEEEKIREEMLQIAKESEDSFYMILTPNKKETLINWLEKQEQSKKTSIWKHWKNGICGNGEGKLVFLIKSGATYSLSSCLSFECDYIELSELENLMLEKQDKQNSNVLWHDVSEEPEEQREIFCKWKGSNIDAVWHDVAFYHADTKTFWDGEHQIEDVIKWAYIDEMIEEQSQSYLAPKSASQAIKEIVVDNANKVELKFHEGDFIKHNKSDIIYKVFSIDNDFYFLKNVETDEIAGKFERFNLEQNFHLWTFKDAKEGDVLSYKTDEGDLWIMIYWSLYKPYEGHVHYHALLVDDNFSGKGTCYIDIDNLKPATKEQHYLLFKKMQEENYKWNIDKKELIKL